MSKVIRSKCRCSLKFSACVSKRASEVCQHVWLKNRALLRSYWKSEENESLSVEPKTNTTYISHLHSASVGLDCSSLETNFDLESTNLERERRTTSLPPIYPIANPSIGYQP